MAELNAGQKNLVAEIDRYRNLLKRTVEEIKKYIHFRENHRFSRDTWEIYSSIEELVSTWLKVVSQKEREWFARDFISALYNDNAPKQVIAVVKKANAVLSDLTEFEGFDKCRKNRKFCDKQIDILHEAACVLSKWETKIPKDVPSGKLKNKTNSRDLAGEKKKEDKPSLQPLREKARLIYEKLITLEPHEAMTLPKIQDWLYDTHTINLDEGTWKEIRKELIPYGLKNRPRIGYYIEKK